MQRKKRDSVLKELEGFHITVKLKNGKNVWGKLKVFPKGMELLFSRSYLNSKNHNISSYIIFPNDLEQIETLFRFHDELSIENQKRRLEEVESAKDPGFFQRLSRYMTNFLSAFHDAIDESLGILINRVKSTSSNLVLKSHDKKLKQLGSSALNIVDHSSWDPILEHYLFKNVVLEIIDCNGKKEEYSGILKDYSSNWIVVLDCEINTMETLPLYDANRLMLQRKLDFWIHLDKKDEKFKMIIRIKNESPKDILLSRIKSDHYKKEIESLIRSGESLDILLDNLPHDTLKDLDPNTLPLDISLIGPERVDPKIRQEINVALPKLFLEYQTMQRLDVIVPRNVGVIRHGNITFEVEKH